MIKIIQPKNEQDEVIRIQRRKALYIFFIKSYLLGFINDFNLVRDLFIQLISPSKDKRYIAL
jgi:hypothetical protein